MSRSLSATKIPAYLKGMHRISYLIGRIAISWGQIEQRIYFDIVRFANHNNPKPKFPYEIKIAKKFESRVQKWKQESKRLAPEHFSDVSAVFSGISRMALVRHNLMHGFPLYFPFPLKALRADGETSDEDFAEPFIEIADHATAVRRVLTQIQKAKATGKNRILLREIYVRYTLRELEDQWREMENASAALFRVSDLVLPVPRPSRLSRRKRR